MTTIAAIQGDGWVVLGFDSRVVDDGRAYILPSNNSKVVRKGEYLLGAAGDMRAINLLDIFVPPSIPKQVSLDRFITSEFIPALKSCFIANGYGDEKGCGSSVLVAIRGVVYEIGEDYEWCRDERGLYAIGSGSAYALGALYAVAEKDIEMSEAKRLMKTSVEIAATLNIETGLPIRVITQTK